MNSKLYRKVRQKKKSRKIMIGGKLCKGDITVLPDRFNPIRDVDGVNVIKKEHRIRRIAGGEILYLDYELLKRDFEYFRDKTDIQIDEYILSWCCVMSHSQHNYKPELYDNFGEITVEEIKKKHIAYYRPPNYGRALIMVDERNNVQIDMKGVGVGPYYIYDEDSKKFYLKAFRPKLKNHRTGCIPLGSAIKEYFNENILRNIINNSRYLQEIGIHTLKSYGIIKLNIALADGHKSQLAIYLRQATNRYIDLFNECNKLIFNVILSHFGISSHDVAGHTININENINIQGTNDYNINNFVKVAKKKIYIIDFAGFNFYDIDFFSSDIFLQNIIKFIQYKLYKIIIPDLVENFNLRTLINSIDIDVLNRIANSLKYDHKISDPMDIYIAISDFTTEFVKFSNPVIPPLVDIIKSLLGRISFWFKCSITRCPSLKPFIEHNTAIKQYLLDNFSEHRGKARELDDIICKVSAEYSELVVACDDLTPAYILHCKKELEDVNLKLQELLKHEIPKLLDYTKEITSNYSFGSSSP